jgi:hypothetical protein
MAAIKRVSAKKYRGLGDVVAAAIKPIAEISDKLLGTELLSCQGCVKRKEKLNKRFPF